MLKIFNRNDMQNQNSPNIAIIDAGGANFLSVVIALEKLGATTVITHDREVILSADAVLLPGVGAAGFAMQKLHEYDLVDVIKNYTRPLLGICLGMQLLYEHSEEDGVDCLGIIKGQVKRFDSKNVTVPHMGWNNLEVISVSSSAEADDLSATKIFNNVNNTDDVYFVHSFYAPVSDATVLICNYGIDFSAVVKYKNFYGMQFHPEKSGMIGEKLLKNFIDIVRLHNM